MPLYQITSKFKECVLSEIEKEDIIKSDEELMLSLLKAVKKCKKHNKKIPVRQRLATVGGVTKPTKKRVKPTNDKVGWMESEGKSW